MKEEGWERRKGRRESLNPGHQRMNMEALQANPYLPHLATIQEVIEETWDTKTFRAVFQDEALRSSFTYKPGQFQEVSVFGVGEATFCLTSTPTRPGFVEFSVKRVGKVTEALHNLSPGDVVGIRGPYGNWFPYEEMKDKDLLFIGGGIGLAPLRSLINFCFDNRKDYGHIQIFYGARTPADLCYREELKLWAEQPDAEVFLTVDKADADWKGREGHVPGYVKEVAPSPEGKVVITCGPPVMIQFVLMGLTEMGFAPEQIIPTLAMKMKCGIGKCGRCNVGHLYVCKDGPVFSYAQLKSPPPEY